MKRAWQRIDRWLGEHAKDVAESLRPGASVAQLDQAAEVLGQALQVEHVESLQVHDGQDREWLFDGWALLPIDEVVAQWQRMTGVLDAGGFAEFETEPDSGIRQGWWRRGWIPFAADGFGNLLCLDADPAGSGRVGEVVEFWHDDAVRGRRAVGLKAWMQKVARELPKSEPETRHPLVVESDGKQVLFRNTGAAQRVALQGQTILACTALEAFAARGDALAGAALAQVAGFRGDWDAVIAHATTYFRDPGVIGACNVVNEQIDLLTRAGVVTGDWRAVERVAEVSPPELFPRELARLRARAAQQVERLESEARARDERSETERWAAYESYLTELPGFKHLATAADRRRNQLANALTNYHLWDEALRIIGEHPDESCFEDALKLAGPLMQRGEGDKAFDLLLEHLDRWSPVFVCRVAPAELLLDPDLRPLMTEDRCERILATPRAHHLWGSSRR